ncbi:hypothetical protein HaLaN_09248 [Haematococcus lacustris]|uniref:Uncharacterized protein n=1 Tax=Haematococcus lacustris TaxID=44745 RepID=A0A699Z310_HAELA|nr:hypothetical protein HaLaN_09248 [Haematococcus lacustris]
MEGHAPGPASQRVAQRVPCRGQQTQPHQCAARCATCRQGPGVGCRASRERATALVPRGRSYAGVTH